MNIPTHVGIIMDGNGRWAKKRNLIRSMGHKAGADNLEKLLPHIYQKGVKYVSVYVFSTENFKRSPDEVNYLMNLFVKMFSTKGSVFDKEQIKVIFSGTRKQLRPNVLEAMDEATKRTANNQRGILNVCLNYGGREEIIDMTKKIAEQVKKNQIKIDDINEDLLSHNLYQILPPVDFVIRTSGEQRTSNFMPWQTTYAEYYFPKVYFPDFNSQEFDKALRVYARRHRRFGNAK